jgi:hypothetical protein
MVPSKTSVNSIKKVTNPETTRGIRAPFGFFTSSVAFSFWHTHCTQTISLRTLDNEIVYSILKMCDFIFPLTQLDSLVTLFVTFSPNEDVMKTALLHCSISSGQFPNEYAVSGTQHDGTGFSLFVSKDLVRNVNNTNHTGLVEVEQIDRKGELVLVRLPAQTFENGQYITVKASDLQDVNTQLVRT